MTFRTNIGQAIANNGWKDGDQLLVKWGYGRTAEKINVDTLTAGCRWRLPINDLSRRWLRN